MNWKKIMLTLLVLALFASVAMPTMMVSNTRAATPTPTATGMPASHNTTVTALQSKPEFSKLADLIKSNNLQDTLNGPGPYTVFAPTNDAISSMPSTRAQLLSQGNNMNYVLRYHVVKGTYTVDDLKKQSELMTTNNVPLKVSMAGNGVMVDGAQITGPTIKTDNGIIHGINTVMIPPMMTY